MKKPAQRYRVSGGASAHSPYTNDELAREAVGWNAMLGCAKTEDDGKRNTKRLDAQAMPYSNRTGRSFCFTHQRTRVARGTKLAHTE